MIENSLLQTKFEAELLTVRRVSPNTFAAYQKDIHQFIQFLNERAIFLVKMQGDETVKQFIHQLYDQGISHRSIARKISALKLFFKYLHETYKIEHCAKEIKAPRLDRKLPNFLSEKEIKSVLELIDSDASLHGERNKIMVYLLYGSGMRVSELVGLKTDQLDHEIYAVKIDGKGGKQRIIPLPENLFKMLIDYIAQDTTITDPKNREKYIFCTRYNNTIKALSRQAFWLIISQLCKKAGIERRISPHIFRHSLATHLLQKGASLRSLQLLLGHESLATVQLYTHIEVGYLRKIYDSKHPRA